MQRKQGPDENLQSQALSPIYIDVEPSSDKKSRLIYWLFKAIIDIPCHRPNTHMAGDLGNPGPPWIFTNFFASNFEHVSSDGGSTFSNDRPFALAKAIMTLMRICATCCRNVEVRGKDSDSSDALSVRVPALLRY